MSKQSRFVRNMVIGIVLLVVGMPLFFLSTSWIGYIGIVLSLAGGVLIIATLLRN